MSLATGDILEGRYEILGTHPGGMGIVYAVRDRETGVRHAAKTIKEEYRDDPRVLLRFEQEVRTWIGLGRHPNLVEAHFFREIDGTPYLFLEYVDGPTLATLISRDGPLDLTEAVDLALQFARGLIHSHEEPMRGGAAGLVHRDIKPENLFVSRKRIGMVSDLGIAKVLSADLESTAEGIGLGTPLYISPEQLKGSQDVDGRSDIYSFGAVLYEMVTGRPPLRAENLESQIYLILRGRPEAPSKLNPSVPRELDRVILRCLEKPPSRRYPGFRPLAEELRGLLEDPAAISTPPASRCPSCGYGSARRPPECPVCGSTMGPSTARAPSVETDRSFAAPGPVRLYLERVEVLPRNPLMGELVTIRLSVLNPGGTAARRGEMHYVLPDPDTFRLVEVEEAWRGDVPPTPPGRRFEIRYGIVPLREGSFTLPALSLAYEDEEGGRRVLESGSVGGLSVSFNYELPLAGRRKEWGALMRCLSARTATFALVEGEAGAGRSRLLADLGRALAEEGFQVFSGKGLAHGLEPMEIFHDVARQVFRIGAETLPAKSLMARVIDRLAPLIGHDPGMAGFFAAALSGAALAESQLRMRDYFWFRLLSAISEEGPVVLLLDNLQWAGEDSADLIESLVRRAHEDPVPILVVGAVLTPNPDERSRERVEHLRNRFAALATTPGLTQRVELTPLGEEDVNELLGVVFPGNTLAEDHPWLLPALTEQTGGKPYHLVRLLRLLREAKDEEGEPLVSAEGGDWMLRPEVNEESLREWIPDGTEEMVRTLVAPLAPEVKETLESAAVMGEEFELPVLEVHAADRDSLHRRLEVLERAGFIRPANQGSGMLRFTSSLVPLAIEKMIRARSELEFARRHREVATALAEVHSPRGLRRIALRYSRHLQAAGDRDEAFRWRVQAAKDLVRQQFFLRADAALVGAGRLLDEGAKADDAVLGSYYFLRGEVARVTGRLAVASKALDQAVRLLKKTGDQDLLAQAYGKIGKVREARGEFDSAFRSFLRGAQVRDRLHDSFGMAHSLNNVGSLQLVRGEEERARETFRRARKLAEESGNAFALADALDHLATLEARSGRWQKAVDLYQESLRRGEEMGDRLGSARSLNGLGSVAVRRGRLEEALEFFGRAIDLRREIGDRQGAATTLSNLGVVHDRLGDFEKARSYYRRSAEAHREIGSRRGLAVVLNNLGVVNLSRGDVTRAVERFEESAAIRKEIGDRERLGLAMQNLGEALAMSGERERAWACFEDAAGLFAATGDDLGATGLAATRSSFRLAEGDLDGALEEIQKALAGESSDAEVRAEIHLVMAEIHLARGDVGALGHSARRGLALAEEGESRRNITRGLRLLGEVLAMEGRTEEALDRLKSAEGAPPTAASPELLRVLLARARIEGDQNAATLARAREACDSLVSRGARLPEEETLRKMEESALRKRST